MKGENIIKGANMAPKPISKYTAELPEDVA